MADNDEHVAGEEAIIQTYLEPLAAGFAGALGLKDDCAVIAPSPGHEFVLKTDPVAEGIHFLADDAPRRYRLEGAGGERLRSGGEGGGARAYLMALSFRWRRRGRGWRSFAAGLAEARWRSGLCWLVEIRTGGRGCLPYAITVLGEVPAERMVQRATARAGDVLFVSGVLGEAAIGLTVRLEPDRVSGWEAVRHGNRP
ncbi:MAG: hypothetical protein R3D67_02165 [Hyphomicrobiaceae bacterium]